MAGLGGVPAASNTIHGTHGQFVWSNSSKPGLVLNVATAGKFQPVEGRTRWLVGAVEGGICKRAAISGLDRLQAD
jgi:hypothetical protein